MCGIAGIYSYQARVQPKNIKMMTDSLRHRGPDDEGFLAIDTTLGKVVSLVGNDSKTRGQRIEDFDQPANLFFGHRRLSIIDLSPAGHQPMCNEDGSLWIVYNGEIYNYVEIRGELMSSGHQFRSQTDTEIVLHAYEKWGADCVGKFNGMWAFAILDLKANRIFCSRDRAGVKPFYFLYDDQRFCFASEIKALLIGLNPFRVEPNEQIIADYLFSGFVDHTNETFFKNIHQLKPGEYLLVENMTVSIKPYWDIDNKEVRFANKNEYKDQFYELLKDSIRLRLRSDVPIGTCLSGGLDSSSIVCLANKLMLDGQQVDPRLIGGSQKTFSSCFEQKAYDERKFIELVIEQTGAEKNYVFPKAEDLSKDLSRLIWEQEEPFASSSVYAQRNVMRLAKERGITVLLDGQGGDELLAGYLPSFYFVFTQALKQIDFELLIREMREFWRNHKLNPIPSLLFRIVPNHLKPLFPRLDRGGLASAEMSFRRKYFRTFPRPKKFATDLNNYLYQIFRSTILPSLLHYEDRNSMTFSLETRLPFLDYRLVEFIFGLPIEQKIRNGTTKVILRNAMKGILPEEVRSRIDKIGFATPENSWFKTILKDQIYGIISSNSFGARGYFDVKRVKYTFEEYCNEKIGMGSTIWRWVNLELWFRMFVDREPIVPLEE